MHRLVFALLAALMLGGCNLVYSEAPLFTAADAAGAPQFRPGVWAQKKADCEFDASKPVKDWPECAGPTIITADQLLDPSDDKSSNYVLAGGEPRVMQFEIREKGTLMYLYAGVEALKRDAQGRITEARSWLAQCGPPPPPQAQPESDEPQAEGDADDPAPAPGEEALEREVKEAMAAGVTREPLPGLEIKDGMCVAREPGPVRNAARESLKWDDSPSVIYWVRDGRE